MRKRYLEYFEHILRNTKYLTNNIDGRRGRDHRITSRSAQGYFSKKRWSVEENEV